MIKIADNATDTLAVAHPDVVMMHQILMASMH
jgi:hypothetical protein